MSVLGRLEIQQATSGTQAARFDQVESAVAGRSAVGHQHVYSDVIDFDDRVYFGLSQSFINSWTLRFDWDPANNLASGTVRLKNGGGLLSDPSGIYINLGSGTEQAARGDHTHSQLHDPVTVGSGTAIVMSINGQQLSAILRIPADAALDVYPTGLKVRFGVTANDAAQGNHTHTQLHDPVSIGATVGFNLGINAAQQLSGTITFDPAITGGRARIDASGSGIYTVTGSGTGQAAAGDHGHAVATSLQDGFLSKQDKIKIDTLSGALATRDHLSMYLDGNGVALLSGTRGYAVAPWSGTIDGWYLFADNEGLSGTLSIDIYRDAYLSFPPNLADRICGSEKPAVAGTKQARDTDLTTWSRIVTRGDVLSFNVDQCSGITKAWLTLMVSRPVAQD